MYQVLNIPRKKKSKLLKAVYILFHVMPSNMEVQIMVAIFRVSIFHE